MPMKGDVLGLALVGPGAIGRNHLRALARIEGAEVVMLVGPDTVATRRVADQFGVANVTPDLDAALGDQRVDALILCGPTPVHADQTLRCLDAGKHVLVEIPLADSLAAAEAVTARAARAGLVAMVAHTRRYNPPHVFLHDLIANGHATVQQMSVETYFLRRENRNALGEPRDWTDHLLWHHAAHTVDLFAWQAGPIVHARALAGPPHPQLGIAMDMAIQLQAESGAVCSLSLSFNNDGPIGSASRYICDSGTWIARYDDLVTGAGLAVDLSAAGAIRDGLERQARDFLDSIRVGRQPLASVEAVLPCYRVLGALDRQLRTRAA